MINLSPGCELKKCIKKRTFWSETWTAIVREETKWVFSETKFFKGATKYDLRTIHVWLLFFRYGLI